MVVQWLGLCALTVENLGWIASQGTKIPQTSRCGKNKNKYNYLHMTVHRSTIHKRQKVETTQVPING